MGNPNDFVAVLLNLDLEIVGIVLILTKMAPSPLKLPVLIIDSVLEKNKIPQKFKRS